MEPTKEQLKDFREKMDTLTSVMNDIASWHEHAALGIMKAIDGIPAELKGPIREQASFHARVAAALRICVVERVAFLALMDDVERNERDIPTSSKLHEFLMKRKAAKEQETPLAETDKRFKPK